jgi:cyclin-dependent kinase 7
MTQSLLETKHVKYKGYQRGEKIGEGTYATVYTGLALSRLSNQPTKIAIKKIKPGLFTDGLDMSAIREIKYLKSIHHPNVIDLIDVVSYRHNVHLILEFLDADLEMIIKNNRVVFGNADIKSWMLMLMRGLEACHQHHILHRDLKPNNLLLGPQGILKIADFGLARVYGDVEMTMTSQVVTRWYRAPELLLGAKMYGSQVDIWSCGCIFAELMLRTPYFASETDIGQLKTIMRARGTPTVQQWPVCYANNRE